MRGIYEEQCPPDGTAWGSVHYLQQGEWKVRARWVLIPAPPPNPAQVSFSTWLFIDKTGQETISPREAWIQEWRYIGPADDAAAPDLSWYDDHPEELPVIAQIAATLAAALIVSSHMHYTPEGAALVYRDVFNAMHKPAAAP